MAPRWNLRKWAGGLKKGNPAPDSLRDQSPSPSPVEHDDEHSETNTRRETVVKKAGPPPSYFPGAPIERPLASSYYPPPLDTQQEMGSSPFPPLGSEPYPPLASGQTAFGPAPNWHNSSSYAPKKKFQWWNPSTYFNRSKPSRKLKAPNRTWAASSQLSFSGISGNGNIEPSLPPINLQDPKYKRGPSAFPGLPDLPNDTDDENRDWRPSGASPRRSDNGMAQRHRTSGDSERPYQPIQPPTGKDSFRPSTAMSDITNPEDSSAFPKNPYQRSPRESITEKHPGQSYRSNGSPSRGARD